MNRKILKIIERCASELDETSRFKDLLTEDCLRFKEPVSIETLRSIRYMNVISEVAAVGRSSDLVQRLVQNIHVIEPAYTPSDNFV